MAVIKTSVRALLLALLPVAILQGALLANALAPSLHDGDFIAPDRVFGLFAAHVGMFGAMLYAGHQALRHLHTCNRGAYSAVGALAAAAAYAMTLRYGLYLAPPYPGAVVTAGILPVLAGALGGFLYTQFAGFEYHLPADDSDAVADDRIDFKGRFDGPVRVRTSLGAIALAAVLPALLIAFIASSLFGLGLPGAPYAMYTALPAYIFVSALFITVVPSGIVVLIAHFVAGSLSWHSGPSYAAAGAGISFAAAVFLFPFSGFTALPFLALPSSAFGAMMGALYRRFAGLEPMPLPEAVTVSEVEALVPHDDATRRSHSIVLNG